jgi:hypothetical protein
VPDDVEFGPVLSCRVTSGNCCCTSLNEIIEPRGRFELTDVLVLPDDADGELPHAPSPSMHPAASAAATYRLILDKSALPVLPGILPQTEVLHRG